MVHIRNIYHSNAVQFLGYSVGMINDILQQKARNNCHFFIIDIDFKDFLFVHFVIELLVTFPNNVTENMWNFDGKKNNNWNVIFS